MTLADALGVADDEVVALIGGGGKTTAMFRLASEVVERGGRVITTTNTHIFATQIAPYAEGRIMTARRAREGKLVDAEGGLRAAIARARARAGLGSGAPVQVWPEKPSFLEALTNFSENTESESSSALLAKLVGARQVALIETLLSPDAASAAVLPYVLSAH